MQYVRKRMAEMDYYNGIRTAEEEGLKEGLKKGEAIGKKIGKKKAEIKWILKLHDGDVPVKIIAQVAEKTVDEVINIINTGKLHRKEKRD
jgi:flagellar biosynthesis/type III secretory pathway protein FliH